MFDYISDTISELVKNNLFTSIFAAWFASVLTATNSALKEFEQSIHKKLFFIRNVLFIVNQNIAWMQNFYNGLITPDEASKNLQHMKLIEMSYSSPLDKCIIKVLSSYETILTNTYISLKLSPDENFKKGVFELFSNTTNTTQNALETIIDIYEKTINNGKKQLILNFFNITDKQQIEYHKKLLKLVENDVK